MDLELKIKHNSNYTFTYIHTHTHTKVEMQLQNHNSAEVDMSGGSSSGKGFGRGSGKGGRKGPPIVWDGPTVGPEFFGEAVYEFPVECKSDFSKDSPLMGYNNRREEWPKYSHGEDCVVQTMTEGTDGGRRFF